MAAAGLAQNAIPDSPCLHHVGLAAAIHLGVVMKNRITRAFIVANAITVVLAGSAAGSSSVAAAAEEVNAGPACEDAVWRVYNDCLVSSDTGWERTICDLAFVLNMRSCTRNT